MSRYALPLTGYDDASVWGYDDQGGTYFAQLWRNASDSRDEPDIWLSGMQPISSPLRLAEMISARTGASMATVTQAMAATAEAAKLDAFGLDR
jgi:hypothetical protein